MKIEINGTYSNKKGVSLKVLAIGPRSKLSVTKILIDDEICVKYLQTDAIIPKVVSLQAFEIWAKEDISHTKLIKLEPVLPTPEPSPILPEISKSKLKTFYLIGPGKISKNKPEKFVKTIRALNAEHARELSYAG